MATTEAPPVDAEAPLREAFDCSVSLPGWKLHLAHLQLWEGRDRGNVMDVAVQGALSHLQRTHPGRRVDETDSIRAIRAGLAELGVDAGAHPPASERLLADFLEKGAIPRGSLAWELLALLTVKSESPWCLLDRDRLEPPLEFRLGVAGEGLVGAEGRVELGGLPVLADTEGVKGSPWARLWPTELEDCREPVFVCALPRSLFRRLEPKSHMGRAIWLTWAYRFVFEKTCVARQGA